MDKTRTDPFEIVFFNGSPFVGDRDRVDSRDPQDWERVPKKHAEASQPTQPVSSWTEDVTLTLVGEGASLEGATTAVPVGGVAAFHDRPSADTVTTDVVGITDP